MAVEVSYNSGIVATAEHAIAKGGKIEGRYWLLFVPQTRGVELVGFATKHSGT